MSSAREVQYLQELNHKKVEEFKRSPNPNNTHMTIAHVSRVLGITSWENIRYTREVVQVNRGRVFIIKREGTPISFVWETDAENIKQAVRHGVHKPEALTGQVICA